MSEWHAVIANELQTRGWALGVSRVPFEQVVLDELRARAVEPTRLQEPLVRRAVVRCYARLLFEKCGEGGTADLQRAFQELWAYLYPRAVFRLHEAEAAKDATQQTLIKVLQKRTTCRDPGSFLRWCEQILIFEISDRFREQYGRRMSERTGEFVEREQPLALGDAVNDDSGVSEESMTDPQQDTLRAALEGPMRDALFAVLDECLSSKRHVRVIADLFFEDKSFLEIAQELQTTPVNIQVMRTRALQKLRDCPEMQRLVEDWD